MDGKCGECGTLLPCAWGGICAECNGSISECKACPTKCRTPEEMQKIHEWMEQTGKVTF